MKNKLNLKVLAIFFTIGIIGIGAMVHNSADGSKDGWNGVISLEVPSFIQDVSATVHEMTEGTSFLEEEAGISAYTNVGQAIDLTKAKNAFRTIEYETEDYIIGSVPLPDYAETEDVHAYVHKDGWVVTYYLNEEPAAKIIDWKDYGTDETITGTKLEDGISVVCNAAGVPMRDIKYYDFKYPNANRLMIVADAIWYGTSPATDTFRLKLPSDFVFYERSFSHYTKNYGGCYMYIDENEIDYASDETNYGLLSPTELSLDEFHTIKITGSGNPGHFDAIVLIYREA